MTTANDATKAQPALASLRVATWDSPSAPGVVITLRGAAAGWQSFYTILAVMKRVFGEPSERPVAFSLVELEHADPLNLSALASSLEDARYRGECYRVLMPSGFISEFLLPRLIQAGGPYRIRRIPELSAIAFDIVE